MSLNSSPETSHESSSPAKEVLSKAQKAILERVIAILDTDPKLKEKINLLFEKNFQSVISDIGKFNLLLEKIGQVEITKLTEIENKYNSNEYSNELAISESRKIIEHYTQMKIGALKGNINSTQSA